MVIITANYGIVSLLLIAFLQPITCQNIINSQVADLPRLNCSEVTWFTSDHIVAYTNWAFKLSCDNFNGNNAESTSSLQCYYSSYNDPTNFKSTSNDIILPDPQVINFKILKVINVTNCWSKNTTVEVRNLPTQSCFDDVTDHIMRDVNVIYLSVKQGDKFVLDCMPVSKSNDSDVILPPSVSNSEYDTVWKYSTRNSSSMLDGKKACCEDCISNSNSRITTDASDGTRPRTVTIYRANYYDPGVYTCEITYDGRKAYIVHYSICIQTDVTVGNPPIVTCKRRVDFQAGEELNLSCDVSIANGKIGPEELSVTWAKQVGSGDRQSVCSNLNLSTTSQSQTDSRITCGIEDFRNTKIICFDHVPPSDEDLRDQKEENKFEVTFRNTNMRKNDMGLYSVSVTHKGLTNEAQVINIEFNPEAELRRIITILVSVLIIIAIVIVVLALLWYYRIQIFLFIRRHNGKYDEDGKEYVAILSYYFSSDLSPVTRERTHKIVKWVREQMKAMNYSFYDCGENYLAGEAAVEGLLNKLDKSHRMILVLTDAYVNERWSRFVAQQDPKGDDFTLPGVTLAIANSYWGYTNMWNEKTKLIVIRTPGTKKALKKINMNQDNFVKELQEVIRASRNIRWKDNMSEARFKDNVQYALPKLKRDNYSSLDKEADNANNNSNIL